MLYQQTTTTLDPGDRPEVHVSAINGHVGVYLDGNVGGSSALVWFNSIAEASSWCGALAGALADALTAAMASPEQGALEVIDEAHTHTAAEIRDGLSFYPCEPLPAPTEIVTAP